jgi:hypothetical protein
MQVEMVELGKKSVVLMKMWLRKKLVEHEKSSRFE